MTTWSLTSIGYEAELDILELRLEETDPFVDVHVLAEADHYYSGEPKPLFFAEHRERFARWLDKIRYVPIRDMPNGNGGDGPASLFQPAENANWTREQHQRRSLKRGCKGMAPGDLVYLSDLDEIPSAGAWALAKHELAFFRIVRPALAMHVGALDWRWDEAIPVIARFFHGAWIMGDGDPQQIRLEVGQIYRPPPDHLDKYGWHLSYAGGAEAMAHKIRTAAHSELIEFADAERLQRCLATGEDIFGRKDRHCQRVGFDALPPAVARDPGRYAHLLA